MRVKVTKNKVAPPFREAEVEIMFGRGIDKIGDLINIATDLDVIQKSGSWYGFSGERLAQGKEKTVELLTDDPELLQNVKDIVLQTLQKTDPPVEEPT